MRPESDDAQAAARDFLRQRRITLEPVAGTHEFVVEHGAPQSSEHERQRIVRNAFREHVGRVGHRDAEFSRGRHVDAVDADTEAGNDLEFGEPAHECHRHAFMARGCGGGNAIGDLRDEGILIGRFIVTVDRVGGVELRHGGGKQRADEQKVGFHESVSGSWIFRSASPM